MRKGNVTAEKINFSRQSRATDLEIEKLAVDIRDNGLLHPVLVDAHTGLLLDGLNRFRAYQLLGWSVVPANFFEGITEAADYLEKIRNGKTIGYQRAMEFYEDFRVLSRQYDALRRKGTQRGTRFPPCEGGRAASSRSTGISENAINRLNIAINLAKAGNNEVMKIVERVYASPAGSPIIGFARILELHDAERSRIVPMENGERVKVLMDILHATETSLTQIPRVGGINTLSGEDAKRLAEKLKYISQLVTAINKQLKRRSKSE